MILPLKMDVPLKFTIKLVNPSQQSSWRKSQTRETAGSRRKNKDTEALLGLFICKRPDIRQQVFTIGNG